MFKYKVFFRRRWQRQIDGWTDCRDREYKIEQRTESVTVQANNMNSAKTKALRKACGYWDNGRHRYWEKEYIRYIKRSSIKTTRK